MPYRLSRAENSSDNTNSDIVFVYKNKG